MNRISKIADRIAGGLNVQDALNGMNRVKAARTVNNILSPLTKGFYRDDAWEAVGVIWNALTEAGIDWTMEGTKYDHDRDGVPTGKTWKFKVDFTNDKGRPMILYGVVVGSGAGRIEDPLERYDLVAYVS